MSTKFNNSIAKEIQTPVENDSRQGRCELVLAKKVLHFGAAEYVRGGREASKNKRKTGCSQSNEEQ